ncbi:MAG: hypothetical protein JO276_08050 [Sphingomonadaceae bacterium]|nr:hypothetical protein [Sphingomonadaceae bacterium]
MRGFVTIAILFLFGAVVAQGGCTRHSGSGADYYARQMQHMVGRSIGPLRLKSIEPDGNVLVFTLDGPEGWRRGTPSYAITAYFLEGFCKSREASTYLAAGRTLRLDTFEDGRSPIRGTPVQHCPHP